MSDPTTPYPRAIRFVNRCLSLIADGAGIPYDTALQTFKDRFDATLGEEDAAWKALAFTRKHHCGDEWDYPGTTPAQRSPRST